MLNFRFLFLMRLIFALTVTYSGTIVFIEEDIDLNVKNELMHLMRLVHKKRKD